MAVAEIFAFEFGPPVKSIVLSSQPQNSGLFLLDRSGSLPRYLSQLILGRTRETPAPLALTSGTETNIGCTRWL